MIKQRKRRYLEASYERRKWPRGMPVYKVAVCAEPLEPSPAETVRPLRFWFHVPHLLLVTTIFDRLQGSLFDGYTIAEDINPYIINGKCYQAWVVTVKNPDLHRLSLPEWFPIIKSMMERRFRVQVTCFESYEKFLNA